MQVFTNNNARFCYQSKEKVLSSLLEECKYEKKKDKNLIDDDLEKSSSDKSGSKSDNDKDNNESNK